MNNQSRMVANYIVVAGSTLWIAEFIETLPTEIDSIWIHVPLGFDISGAKGVTRKWDKQGIEALEPGISTVGSTFQVFSRCKTNPKGELPLNQRDCTSCNQYVQTLSRSIQYSANHRPGWYSLFPSYPRLSSDRWHFVNLSPRYQRDLRETQLYAKLYGRQDCLTYHTQQDPLSDVVGPFFNVFSNLLISRLMLNLHTFTTSTITTSQGAASTDQSSSLHFAQQMLGNRNIGGTLDGDFVGEEIEFE
ncbi:hypothetical protein EV359DRAFT_61987 [Lentinula novae-zelandiae]|nr:hypothetical protein EV359DRAFT_61987 [Lentinula novae-zelandiae]